MRTRSFLSSSSSRAGFSLIEMIGVMAIMAILATVLVPNTLKMIERAAIRAEQETMDAIAEHVRFYARDLNALPAVGNWYNDLTGPMRFSSLSPAEVRTNRRGLDRLYVVDPVVANQRALIISRMRSDIALPTSGQVSGNFLNVWNTPPNTIPPGAGWGGWTANNVESLVIERVNCRRELQQFVVTLKNSASTTDASYQIVWLSGATPLGGPVNRSTPSLPLTNLRTGDRLRLFRIVGGVATLDYDYVVGSRGASFEFNGTTWFSPSSP
jgi:prepilin-type N-terminal cleavage/methylation domain-containing protein